MKVGDTITGLEAHDLPHGSIVVGDDGLRFFREQDGIWRLRDGQTSIVAEKGKYRIERLGPTLPEFATPAAPDGLAGMAVTVTLVFADESHREAWLERAGLFAREVNGADYERRKRNTNLVYLVGPVPAAKGG